MFLEVKTEPDEIVIQRKTKRGQWKNVANIVNEKRMSYYMIKRFIELYWESADLAKCNSDYDEHIRAVIIGRKSGRIIQVLSSDGLDFYDSLDGHCRAYWSVYNKSTGDKLIYTGINGSIFNTFEDFHEFIIKHDGIKKARMRRSDESDDWLKTWDLTFNDNTEISLSFLEAA